MREVLGRSWNSREGRKNILWTGNAWFRKTCADCLGMKDTNIKHHQTKQSCTTKKLNSEEDSDLEPEHQMISSEVFNES